jgi:glycosyltransferase involved in cell wall biosynthesis
LPAAAAGKVVVAFFGRLSSEKAPDIFVEIARTLSSCGGLFFVMTGEGPEREKTLALIREYGLEDHFHVPGFVDNVEPLMRVSDIIVLPSRIDGMPLVVLEAQALGKPVVASRVGSLPLMVEHESSGFLCEISDLPEFCRRILLLANDPGLRKKMGLLGHQNIQTAYRADRMLAAYEDLFQRTPKSSTLDGQSHTIDRLSEYRPAILRLSRVGPTRKGGDASEDLNRR